MDSWKWAAQQVREYPQDPDWKHAGLTDKIGVAFAEVFIRVARRRYPPELTPPLFAGVSELWRIIRIRRAECNNWDAISSPVAPPEDCACRGERRIGMLTVSGKDCARVGKWPSSMAARAVISDSRRNGPANVHGWQRNLNSIGRRNCA